jgi:hypothetical protein
MSLLCIIIYVLIFRERFGRISPKLKLDSVNMGEFFHRNVFLSMPCNSMTSITKLCLPHLAFCCPALTAPFPSSHPRPCLAISAVSAVPTPRDPISLLGALMMEKLWDPEN